MLSYYYRKIPYILGFLLGFSLLTGESRNFSHTLIPGWLSCGMFIFISLIAFSIIRKKPNRPFPSRPWLTLVVCGLSCALPACSLIYTINYYFLSEKASYIECPITGIRMPTNKSNFVELYSDCNGIVEMALRLPPTLAKDVEKATQLKVSTRRGLLGFDVVEVVGWK
jgi:hypothetical protein